MTDVHLTSVPAARVDQVAKIGDPYPFNPFRKRYNRKASRIDPPHERTRGDGGRSSPGSARAGDIGLGWRLAVSWEAGAFIWLAPL
jgi:hypothetical protein